MPASPEITSVYGDRLAGICTMRPAICDVTRTAAEPAATSPAARDQARSATATPAHPEKTPSSGAVAPSGPWWARCNNRARAPTETCAVSSPAAAASAQPSNTPAVPEYRSSCGPPPSSHPRPPLTSTATEAIQSSARRAVSAQSSLASTVAAQIDQAQMPGQAEQTGAPCIRNEPNRHATILPATLPAQHTETAGRERVAGYPDLNRNSGGRRAAGWPEPGWPLSQNRVL